MYVDIDKHTHTHTHTHTHSTQHTNKRTHARARARIHTTPRTFAAGRTRCLGAPKQGRHQSAAERRAVEKVRPGALHLRAHHVDESAVAGLHPCLAQDLTHRRFTGMLQPHRSRATTRARRSASPRMHGPCHNIPRSRLDSAQVRSVPVDSPRARGKRCVRARLFARACVDVRV